MVKNEEFAGKHVLEQAVGVHPKGTVLVFSVRVGTEVQFAVEDEPWKIVRIQDQDARKFLKCIGGRRRH